MSKFIMEGTWVKDRKPPEEEWGCISAILDLHHSGTVRIQWRNPQSTEWMSARMFREKLRSGEFTLE